MELGLGSCEDISACSTRESMLVHECVKVLQQMCARLRRDSMGWVEHKADVAVQNM